MSTTSGNTNLVNTEDNTKVIETLPTLAGGYTDSTFIVNKWGYKKNRNTDNYNSFPATQTLLENDERTNEDIANLRFGTKIDYLQESGTYATNIEFNLVANPLVNYMQDLNPALCTTTPMTVMDKRDNQEYIIQRLADGNCWMMTNLNLGATALTTDLTSANTNLSTTVTAATFNGWKKSTGTGTYTAGEYIPVSGTDSTSQTPYGTLYNYCATSAGTICTSSNSSNATYDICPKGWRLPTGGSSGEFQTLYNNASYNTYAKMRAPYTSGGAAFALAGFFDNAAPVNQGSYGIYWSSTWSRDTAMYGLTISTSSVTPADNETRYRGYSIRCILDDPRTISDITTMQEMNPQIAAKMNNGDTATLKDSRDGQDYTITKINGNLWMTQNLRYQGDTVGSTSTTTSWIMKSATSNISADKTMTMTDLTAGNSYDVARYHDSGNTSTGVWYNYAAASAMSIIGSSNSIEATESVCPTGWRLPSSSEFNKILSYASIFNPITDGNYWGGTLNNPDQGVWWSSTAVNGINRYALVYRNNSLSVSYFGDDYRYGGHYIRCIAK